MANASASGNSISVSWTSFGTSGNTVKAYNIEVYKGSYLVASTYGLSSSARSYNFYNLEYSTYYSVKVYAPMQVGANKVEWAYVTTGAPAIPKPSTPTGFRLLEVGNGYASLAWNWQSDNSNWCLEIMHSATNQIVWSNYNITSTSMHVSPLSNGVNYYAKLYASNQSGNSSGTYVYGIVPSAPPPSTPTGLTVSALNDSGQVRAYWNQASNASSYYVTARLNNEYGQQVWSTTTTSTAITITGLAEYKQYAITVSATNSSGQSSNYTYAYVTTKDVSPPTISNLSGDGNGKMYMSFSGYDSGSGMRPTSTYYTEITNANGGIYGNGAYSTNAYRTFIVDGSGNTFVNNAYYTMRVTAFDASGNYRESTVRIQYKIARPVSWTWHTSKVKGQTIGLTASEWNSFCLRINQFRQYKNLSNYSFTNVTAGSPITAVIMNQAVSAIGAMVSTHGMVSKGSPITASFFNTLSTSLNSIS